MLGDGVSSVPDKAEIRLAVSSEWSWHADEHTLSRLEQGKLAAGSESPIFNEPRNVGVSHIGNRADAEVHTLDPAFVDVKPGHRETGPGKLHRHGEACKTQSHDDNLGLATPKSLRKPHGGGFRQAAGYIRIRHLLDGD
jgi:hypothetical protein